MALEEKICIWKEIAIDDMSKMATGGFNVTLGPNNKCHRCDGRDEDCSAYDVLEEKYKPA
jgi:hypothetical protein